MNPGDDASLRNPNWQAAGLNERAHALSEQLIARADSLRIAVYDDGVQVPIVDCGVEVAGSLEAGLLVANICLGGRGRADLVPYELPGCSGIGVRVQTDDPVAACLASQYAGWRLVCEDYFAMGSGPMRAAAAEESLIQELNARERSTVAVGVLEASKFPPQPLALQIATACDVEPRRLNLLVARTGSLVGTIQVVARSVETALHKLWELKFDVRRVLSGIGVAPLPPSGTDDLRAMGRTNDAILYGAHVSLWITGDDASLEPIVEQIPSCASRDFGHSFVSLFEKYHRDFYQMDPLLFSPARVTICNVDTGRFYQVGQIEPSLVGAAFDS